MARGLWRRAAANPLVAWRKLRRRFLPGPRLLASHEVYVAIGSLTFGRAPRLPLTEIFPGIEATPIDLERAFDRTAGMSLESAELMALCALARFAEARTVLEIGTFDGNTALNLAANTPPDARIFTVDLPPDGRGRLALAVPEFMDNSLGLEPPPPQFAGTPQADKITAIQEDSAKLDWGRLAGAFDLVFIDGCHHYDYVVSDTRNAIAHLAPDGIVVWHDYGMIEDVSRAVDATSDRLDVVAARGTRLAIGRRRRGAV